MFDIKFAAVVAIVGFMYAIWYNYTSTTTDTLLVDQVDKEYDYVVVGGGTAGSVLASRLSEDPSVSVLLLEAGGHYNKFPNVHVPAYAFGLLKTEIDWGYFSEQETDIYLGLTDRKSIVSRGRVLGGSSAINLCVHSRGSPYDFDEWKSVHSCESWGYQDLLPYFKKAEDVHIARLRSSEYRGIGGPIAVLEPKVTSLNEYFLKAGFQMGYKETDYNGKMETGFSASQLNIRDGVRSSAALEYLGHIAERQNLHVSVNSLVVKVDILDRIAKGVYFINDGRKLYVKAKKEIILSSGAYNTPQILMVSGIGPRNHLKEIGIPLISDLPVGLMSEDHVGIILSARIDKPISLSGERLFGTWSKVEYNLFGTRPLSYTLSEGTAFLHIDRKAYGKKKPDLQFILTGSIIGSADFVNYNESVSQELIEKYKNVSGFSVVICLLHPDSRGRIRLRSRDPFDSPVIEPNNFRDDNDVNRLIAGIRLFEELMSTPAMTDLGADISVNKASFCSQYTFRTDEFWRCMIQHIGINFYHTTSTCKMGPEKDQHSVVDTELRVKTISGLRVCDASVFPSITSGNTHAPVIAVAEKAADMIRMASKTT